MTDPTIASYHFADENFLRLNEQYVDEYVALRVRGHHPHTAFRRVFGAANAEQHAQAKIDNLESSKTFQTKFEHALKTTPISDIINDRRALVELLSMYRSPFVRDSSRLAALREAMVLAGITVVDENGKTKRAGASLADFYANEADLKNPPLPAYGPDDKSAAPPPPALH